MSELIIVSKSAKDIAKVAFATLGSRILGLARDAATMASLGMGAISAAYTFAFTLPNLFRRLLGEGALASAMVPVFSQALRDGGTDEAFAFLNKTLTRAAILFFAVVVLFSAAALAAGFGISGAERFVLGAQFSALMMPYMLLICLAAVFSAALNVLGSFGAPSVGPMALNISIIAAIFCGRAAFGANMEALAWCMCAGWLVGGAFQLTIPAAYMRKKGWRFKFDLGKSPRLSELYALFIPACLGAAVIQINILVSKMLALFISDAALPAIYISSRLVELPLGVFTLAIATVYFPKLALLNSKRARGEYKESYARGFVMTMCVTIPAAAGLALLGRDILTVLFEWGIFKARDVDICLPVLAASAIALPFYAISTFATRGFHSAKDMKTPMRVSCAVIAVNVFFSLLLMFKWQAVGLALANTAAAAVQAAMLSGKLGRAFGSFGTRREILKIVAATAAMCAFVALARAGCGIFLEGKPLALASCFGVIPAAILFYFGALWYLNFKQLRDFKLFFAKSRWNRTNA